MNEKKLKKEYENFFIAKFNAKQDTNLIFYKNSSITPMMIVYLLCFFYKKYNLSLEHFEQFVQNNDLTYMSLYQYIKENIK